jgi:hypothetical protein
MEKLTNAEVKAPTNRAAKSYVPKDCEREFDMGEISRWKSLKSSPEDTQDLLKPKRVREIIENFKAMTLLQR